MMYQNQDSALASSISRQKYPMDFFSTQHPFLHEDESSFAPDRYPFQQIPSIETGLSSNPGSPYGSPPEDLRNPISPIGRRGLTALDAPLPASFDSNGISHIARYGPIAASVPSKFGLESPMASLSQRNAYPSAGGSGLRSAAVGNNNNNNNRPNVQNGMSPTILAEDQTGPRQLHSQRLNRPAALSASVPRVASTEEWEDLFHTEEDLLPPTLHDDVLTPQEKLRRMSRPEQEIGGLRERNNDLRIPSGNSSKVGSPLGSSPSRFSALFAQQNAKKDTDMTTSGASAFGHVGSPLRESVLQHTDGSEPAQSGFSSFSGHGFTNSPRNSSASGIAEQMRRMKIGRTESSEPASKPSTASTRYSSAPISRIDRTISSPRMTSTRIEEEGPEMLFSMDEENSKRTSMIWGSKSPNLGPLVEDNERTISRSRGPGSHGIASLFGVKP